MAKFWEKLFGKRKETLSDEDTLPIQEALDVAPTMTQPRTEEVTKPLSPLSSVVADVIQTEGGLGVDPPQLTAACAQSVGQQRDHNEDALFSLTMMMASNAGSIPFGLYIVADGMGGHQHGEVASEIATRSMAHHIIAEIFINLVQNDPQPPEDPLQDILQIGVQKAHDNILSTLTGGGTTLTAVVVLGNQMTIAHVGDSRVYEINLNGRMKPLTRDHSLVKRLEELGQLTAEEAAVDPRRNVLYHALGQGSPLEPEIISAPIPHPGYLLVCSDGLWGVISEDQIGEIITTSETLPIASQRLIDAANAAGGPDNITAILVRLPD